MIDYSEVAKECNRIGVWKKGLYNPSKVPFNNASWIIELSMRGLGKTTGWLLYGMVAHELYGTRIEYCRVHSDMVTKKQIQNMFDTIKECGYIEKITKGKWNDCFVFGGFWYYRFIDDEGNVVDKSKIPFCHCFGLNDNYKLKSAYTSPTGDIIILDEFIDNKYAYNDYFTELCDIMSTIFRNREYCKIVMLSNTIDIRTPWFSELSIMNDVQKMRSGEKKVIESLYGTHIYVHLIAPEVTSIKQKLNSIYFGFKNPKLNSITGADVWAYANFPRQEKFKDTEIKERYKIDVVSDNIFLEANGFYVRLKIMIHEKYGFCVNVERFEHRPTCKGDIIIVSHSPLDTNELNIATRHFLCENLLRLYREKRWYYSDNSCGTLVASFFKQI